jgi:flagellar secretion chaperone FliS
MIDPEAFLRQEVESASPAKLRWLLIQKAYGLSIVVRDLWSKDKAFEAKQWVIRIQDIFTELLEGIVDPKHPLAGQQSDLYVFLSKLLILAESHCDLEAMQNISDVLEIEKDSWEMLARGVNDIKAKEPVISASDSGSETYRPFSLDA